MSSGFSIIASSLLTATVARTLANLISHATKKAILVAVDVTFNGADSTKVPVLVELCGCTQGAAGTSTAFTPLLLRGDPAEVAVATAAINYTVEPTTLVVLKSWYVTPTGGVLQQLPLGREVEGTPVAASARKGLAIRCTAPFGVDVKTNMEFEEG